MFDRFNVLCVMYWVSFAPFLRLFIGYTRRHTVSASHPLTQHFLWILIIISSQIFFHLLTISLLVSHKNKKKRTNPETKPSQRRKCYTELEQTTKRPI